MTNATNTVSITNTNVTTNANAYLLFPTAVYVLYATGSAAIGSWNSAQTWTAYTPGVSKFTTSGTTLTFNGQFSSTQIIGAGGLSGNGDGTNYTLVRIWWTPVSSII